MNKTDQLREIIGLQADLFQLVSKYPSLKERPLVKYTEAALTSVTELYNATLVETIKTLPTEEARKLTGILQGPKRPTIQLISTNRPERGHFQP